MEKFLPHSIVKAALCAAFIFCSHILFSQGNSGNGQGSGSGKPSISSLGLGKLPMWGLNANSIDSTAIFGSTNNMPVKVVVNNILRGSFTNSGMELVGNFHSAFASVDSIVSSWKIIAEILQAEAVRSEQYYQNDTLIDLVNLQTTVANIKSSQWQNDTVNPSNIFYSGGNVGIGVSNPSVPLEVSGSLKITGSDTTGSGGGGGGGGGGGTPPPAPSRSIIIDGGLDRIIATSGTLDFGNTNLTTTGSFQSSSITTANLTIIDKIESDSMHARKSIEINNSLRLLRDTSVMYAEMSTKDTAVALMLQKDAAAPVVIGDAPAPPPGESRAKLTVAGNTKLDGQLNVTGDITSAGTISANTFNAEKFSADTLFVTRIMPAVGDSEIHFGDGSIVFAKKYNRMFSTPTFASGTGLIQGLAIGANALAKGYNSIAIGTNAGTSFFAGNAITIGNGVSSSSLLENTIQNSLMIGFNSNIPTLFVGQSAGAGTTGNIGIGTTNPKEKMQIGELFTFHNSQFDNAVGRNFYRDGTDDKRIIQEPAAVIYFSRDKANYGITLMTSSEGSAGSVINWNRGITIKPNGQVYIGKTDVSAGSPYAGLYQLAVDGMIISKRARVSAASWADYVCKKDYLLMTLEDVEAFIEKYGHLPGMPSEKEVIEQGLDLGDMSKLHQVKIEEIIKYIIEQDKEIKYLKARINEQDKKIAGLKKGND